MKNNRLVIKEINKINAEENEWASKSISAFEVCVRLMFFLFLLFFQLLFEWMTMIFDFRSFSISKIFPIRLIFEHLPIYRFFDYIFSSLWHIELAIAYFNHFSSFCFSFLSFNGPDLVFSCQRLCEWFNVFIYLSELENPVQFSFCIDRIHQ